MNGRTVKERREAAGMTQRQLSDRTGLTERTLSAIERGVANPQFSTLEALAAALGTTVAELLTESDATKGAA